MGRMSSKLRFFPFTYLKVGYSRKILVLFSLPKRCAVFYPKLCILNFLPFDTAVQLGSADYKQNAISKYLFQDSFWHILGAMRKMHHTF